MCGCRLRVSWTRHRLPGYEPNPLSTSERKGNNSTVLKDFDLKAKASGRDGGDHLVEDGEAGAVGEEAPEGKSLLRCPANVAQIGQRIWPV